MAIDHREQVQTHAEEMAVGRGIGLRNPSKSRADLGGKADQSKPPNAQVPIPDVSRFPDPPAQQEISSTAQTPVQRILSLLGIHHR